MKTYRATLKKGVKGVYGISLVDRPAMEGDFIQFAKQEEVKFTEIDKSKRRIMGLVLEPNKLVYRNQNGEEFNIMFTEKDIEDVAYNFQKQHNQNNSTIQHSGNKIEGVTFVESWIVEDSKIDKSANFGLEYPKGSWMSVMQIDNEELWLNYIETGKVKGFSIDALMSFEEIKLNNQNQVNMEDDKSIMEEVKNALSKLLSILSPKETIEEEVPLAEETEDEKMKRLAKEKLDKEASDKVALEAKEEADKLALEKVEDAKKEAVSVAVNLAKEELEKTIEEKVNLAVQEAEKPLKEKNLALTKEIEVLTAKNLELSEKPATESINKKKNVELKYSEMTNVQQMRYNKENKR